MTSDIAVPSFSHQDQHRSGIEVQTPQFVEQRFPHPDGYRQLVAGWLLSHRSENTRRAYSRDFETWCMYLGRAGIDPMTVRRGHVDAWARELEEVEGLKPSTVARRLATLSSFYTYAVREGALDTAPTANVRRPKTGEGHVELTPGLERDDLVRLLAAAETPRDRALVLVLAVQGLRVAEALSIDFEGITTVRGHQTILVTGKGGRVDRVPLPPVVLDAISQVASAEGRASGPVFLDGKGGRLDRHGVTWVLARLSRRAGLAKQVRPHMLRVTAITGALDAGASLRDVQDFARHSDPRTTRRYDRSRGALDRHASYTIARWLDTGT